MARRKQTKGILAGAADQTGPEARWLWAGEIVAAMLIAMFMYFAD